MAINTVTIQHRRGSLEDFNPDKMVPGELAFTTDGSRKVFAAFAPGDYKELASPEEVQSIADEFEQNVHEKIEDAVNQIEDKTQESLDKIAEFEDKANVIEVEKSGETIIATDSSDTKLRGMNVYGKSTQRTTTGKNLVEHSVISGAISQYASVLYAEADLKPSTEYSISFKGTANNKIYLNESLSKNYVSFRVSSDVTMITFTTADTLDRTNTMQYSNGDKGWLIFKNEIEQSSANVFDNLQIELGSKATEYEPYTGGKPSPSPEFPQAVENCENTEVSVCGKNWLENTVVNKTVNGVTFTVNADKTITVNGTATADTTLTINNPSLPSGDYILNGCPKGGAWNTYSLQYKYGSQETGNGLNITVSDSKSKNIRIVIYAGVTLSNVVFKPMIRLASIADSTYEPYKEKQSLTIPYTLCGIPVSSGGNYTDDKGQEWVCDEVDMERGVYVQRIGVIDFNIDEVTISSYSTNTSGKNRFKLKQGVCPASSSVMPSPIMCTITNSISNDDTYRCVEGVATNTNGEVLLYLNDTSGMTASSVFNWLKEKETKVYYLLATPVETPLTAEQIAAYKALHSNYPTATILTNNGAGMMVKYGADTKLYIDNKFAELAAQLV